MIRSDMSEIELKPKVAVRLSGTGGQGLLLAGRILAEAASIYDGLNVVQTNSYGPEARGGASRSEVIISRGEVDDLHAERFDVLVALSQKACDSYYDDLAENGVLIVDSTNVLVVPTSRAIEIPMTRIAALECGDKMVANILSLGALCGFTKIVTLESLEAALQTAVRREFLESNRKALQLGFQASMEIAGTLLARKHSHVRDFSIMWNENDQRRKAHKNGVKPSDTDAMYRAHVA